MLQSFPLVRLAALDLDGTLLNRNNEVTLATRQAIARAVEHGVVVVPATGRPLASLPPVVAKLPGIRYAITSNGAAVWDLGDDPMGAVHSAMPTLPSRHTSEPACLLHRLMPTEVAREAFDLFQQYDGELSVFSDGLAIKTPEGIAKLTSRTAHFLSSEARQNLTDGRFTVTYCTKPELMSKEEIESVGYQWANYDEISKRYDPHTLKEAGTLCPTARRSTLSALRPWACGSATTETIRQEENRV